MAGRVSGPSAGRLTGCLALRLHGFLAPWLGGTQPGALVVWLPLSILLGTKPEAGKLTAS